MMMDLGKWVENNKDRSILLKKMQDEKIQNGASDYDYDDMITIYQYDYENAMMTDNFPKAKTSVFRIIGIMTENIYKKYCE